MRKRTISSVDVAERAGVSRATVSYVLNGRSDKTIQDATRDRVLRAAEELRYRANRLSHGVLRGKTGLVGVVVPSLELSYFSALAQGVFEECAAHDLQPLIVMAKDDIEFESRQIQRLLEYRVDGLVCIAYNWQQSRMEHWLDESLEKSIPCIILDDRLHADVVDCVVSDDVAGAEMAVNHLLRLGHTRIGHLGGRVTTTTGRDRRIGYTNALNFAGIRVQEELIVGDDYNEGEAAKWLNVLLKLPTPPSAIFAANDEIALGALAEVRRLNLRVPGDLSIVGYGDLSEARGHGLSTVAQHPIEMGRASGARLWRRISDPNLKAEVLIQPVELAARTTTGSARDKI